MERMEQNVLMNGNDKENEVDTKIQDLKFIKKYKKDWEEVTATLRQIYEESLNNKNKKQREIYRPTSSSVVFK